MFHIKKGVFLFVFLRQQSSNYKLYRGVGREKKWIFWRGKNKNKKLFCLKNLKNVSTTETEQNKLGGENNWPTIQSTFSTAKIFRQSNSCSFESFNCFCLNFIRSSFFSSKLFFFFQSFFSNSRIKKKKMKTNIEGNRTK
jgi:hypothetical protein